MAFKNKFDGGELDKWTLGAVDDPVYQRGCAWLENFQMLENGGINRRAGWKYISEILTNTDDDAVKLIPLSIDGSVNYIVYFSKSKYGYLKFNGDIFESRVEKNGPAPLFVKDDHIVAYKEKDPDAYYAVEEIGVISADEEIPLGALVKIIDASGRESAEAEIVDVLESGSGRAVEIKDVFEPAKPVLLTEIISQDQKDRAPGTAFFEETGVGTGLRLQCTIGDVNEKTKTIKITTMVLSGGEGYKGDSKGNKTLLLAALPSVGDITLTAVVSPAGAILSVDDYTVYADPPPTTKDHLLQRYGAAVIGAGVYSEIYDLFGNSPAPNKSPSVEVSVTERSGGNTHVGPFYDIEFTVIDGGEGYINSVAGEDTIYLKLMYTADVRGSPCVCELRCIGHLGPDGGITSINKIEGWFDAAMCTDDIDGLTDILSYPLSNIQIRERVFKNLLPCFKFISYDDHSTSIGNEVAKKNIALPLPRLPVDTGRSSGCWGVVGEMYNNSLWVLKYFRVDERDTVTYKGVSSFREVNGPATKESNWRFDWPCTYIVNSKGVLDANGVDVGPPIASNGNPPLHYYQYGPDFSYTVMSAQAREKRYRWHHYRWHSGYDYYIAHDSSEYYWYSNAAAQWNWDDKSVASAFPQAGIESPVSLDVLRGAGASGELEMNYDHAAERVEVKFRIKEAGTDYFKRGVNSIDLNIYFKTDKQDYAYKLVFAGRRGPDGMLVLDGADVDGWVYALREPLYLEERADALNNREVALYNAGKAQVTALARTEKALAPDGWNVSFEVLKTEKGVPVSTGGFETGQALFIDGYGLTAEVAAIAPMRGYTTRLLSGGKYRNDITGYTSAVINGAAAVDVEVLRTRFHALSTLYETTAPDNDCYKVSQDETMGMQETFWRYIDGRWEEQAELSLPKTDDAVNAAQYVYNGAFIGAAARGVLPFILKIEDDDIKMLSFDIKTTVEYDLTAPVEFEYKPVNVILDKAVPVRFCRDPADSPTVIYYDNGRWWFAATRNDPNRIWASKPVKDKSSRLVDFSTYINFLTITPKLKPFRGRNDIGSDIITSITEGVIGVAGDILWHPTKGKEVSFGFINPEILGTPYFPDGARIVRISDVFKLSAASIAQPREYTESAMTLLNSTVANNTGNARLRVTIPGAGCSVEADCDGFAVRTYPPGVFIGVLSGVFVTAQLAVPYTGWGTSGAETAGRIANATVAAAFAGSTVDKGLISLTCGAILATARAVGINLLKSLLAGVKLNLTDGSVDSGPGYNDTALTSYSIADKAAYIFARNKMYEPAQPFVLRSWEVKEDPYSTVGCGFTFTMASDEKEEINFISNNRSFFVSTTASERSIPSTVNGEVQSAQTGSFFGGEKIQPAKAADALYFVQKGGQRVMRSFWQPNVAVPTVTDVQKYNREILRGRRVLSMKSSRTLPVTVWSILNDGSAAVITDAGGHAAWSRITTEAGDIKDTAAMPVTGMAAIRVVAVRNEKGTAVYALPEKQSEPDDIFLDGWRPYISASLLSAYTRNAVVFDRVTRRVYRMDDTPPPGEDRFIGYLFTSKMRTLPCDAARGMKPARVARARLRFLESALPYIKGFPSGPENKIVAPDPRRVLDGITDIPISGNVELDAAFEVYTKEPEPLSIIAFITEEE